jgi:hypothetical protein
MCECFDKAQIMWSKNPNPVFTFAIPFPSKFTAHFTCVSFVFRANSAFRPVGSGLRGSNEIKSNNSGTNVLLHTNLAPASLKPSKTNKKNNSLRKKKQEKKETTNLSFRRFQLDRPLLLQLLFDRQEYLRDKSPFKKPLQQEKETQTNKNLIRADLQSLQHLFDSNRTWLCRTVFHAKYGITAKKNRSEKQMTLIVHLRNTDRIPNLSRNSSASLLGLPVMIPTAYLDAIATISDG